MVGGVVAVLDKKIVLHGMRSDIILKLSVQELRLAIDPRVASHRSRIANREKIAGIVSMAAIIL